MKYTQSKIFLITVRSVLIFFLISSLCIFTIAWKTKKITADVFKELGLTQLEANNNIKYSFLNGNFTYNGARNAKNIVAGNRVAIINDLVAYAKKYIASEEFKKEYNEYRTRNRPVQEGGLQVTADMIRAQEKERIEKAIKTTEANANSTNEKLRNSVPLRLENLKKELAALDDPNNKTIKMKLDNINRSNEYGVKLYNDKLQKFETNYPEKPELLIKKRLQQMLDITADVDYNAELKEQNKFKVFVNPVYEAKPKEWKLAFRAGKPATDAVRAAAQQWLQQITL